MQPVSYVALTEPELALHTNTEFSTFSYFTDQTKQSSKGIFVSTFPHHTLQLRQDFFCVRNSCSKSSVTFQVNIYPISHFIAEMFNYNISTASFHYDCIWFIHTDL